MLLCNNTTNNDMEVEKCKIIVKQVKEHLKDEMEDICNNVTHFCITPKMSVIANQKLYNFLLTRLMDLWATLTVFEEMLKRTPWKYKENSFQCMINNVLKIYNNSIVNIETGEIIKLPNNLAIIFKKIHSPEDMEYYDLITKNKNILTIIC